MKTPCLPNPCATTGRTTCAVVGTQFECRCALGFAPTATGCAPTPLWSCDDQHSGGATDDTDEPDECPPLARTMSADGQPVQRTMSSPLDRDWFRLTDTAGRTFRAKAEAASGGRGLIVEAFDATGLLVLATSNASASVVFTATSDVTYLQVRSTSDTFSGAYTFRVEPLSRDDWPNAWDGQTTIAAGARFSGVINSEIDVDVVGLVVPPRRALALSLDGGAQTTVEVFNREDGGTLFELAAPTRSLIVSAAAGPLALRARGPESSTGYEVTFTDLGADQHGDSAAFGSRLEPGTQTVLEYERYDDRDVLLVPTIANHGYRLEVNPSFAIDVSIVDSAGSVLRTPFGLPEWNSPSTGTSVIVTQRLGSASPVTARVVDLGVDDQPNQPPATTQLAIGAATEGVINTTSDVDVFEFMGQANRIYEFQCYSRSTNGNCRIAVLPPIGAQIGDFSTLVRTLSSVSGPFIVSISGGGSYQVTVADLGVDDHGDTAATATPIMPGSVPFIWNYGSDIDAFSFPVVAGHVYSASCQFCSVMLQGSAQAGNGVRHWSFVAAASGSAVVLARGTTLGQPDTLVITDLGTDDFGNAAQSATSITVDTPVNGVLEYTNDIDAFSIDAGPNRFYAVTACAFCTVTMAGSGLTSSTGNPWVFRTTAATSAIITVAQLPSSTPPPFSYALQVTDHGVDDVGDTPATATRLTTDGGISGQLTLSLDVDYFAFDLPDDHIYRVESGNPQVRVQISRGNTYLGEGASMTFRGSIGAYTAAFRDAFLATVRPYTITLNDLGPDDYGDTPSTATSLTRGVQIQGINEYDGDQDAFVIATTPGVPITVRLAGGTGLRATLNQSPFSIFGSPTPTQVTPTSNSLSISVWTFNGAPASYTLLVQ